MEILDIRGVADLAHLAIAGNIDLFGNDMVNGIRHRSIDDGMIDGFTDLVRYQLIAKRLWPRQTADMRS